MQRFQPSLMVAEPKPPLVPLRGDSPMERARAAAAASHARAEHNTKRERGNTRSPEWQFRARMDADRAKVGTSREGVSGGSTYVQIYSVLFIARSACLSAYLKNQTGAGEGEGDREQWPVYSRCHRSPLARRLPEPGASPDEGREPSPDSQR